MPPALNSYKPEIPESGNLSHLATATGVGVYMVRIAFVAYTTASADVGVQLTFYIDFHAARTGNLYVTDVGFQIGSTHAARTADGCFYCVGTSGGYHFT